MHALELRFVMGWGGYVARPRSSSYSRQRLPIAIAGDRHARAALDESNYSAHFGPVRTRRITPLLKAKRCRHPKVRNRISGDWISRGLRSERDHTGERGERRNGILRS